MAKLIPSDIQLLMLDQTSETPEFLSMEVISETSLVVNIQTTTGESKVILDAGQVEALLQWLTERIEK